MPAPHKNEEDDVVDLVAELDGYDTSQQNPGVSAFLQSAMKQVFESRFSSRHLFDIRYQVRDGELKFDSSHWIIRLGIHS